MGCMQRDQAKIFFPFAARKSFSWLLLSAGIDPKFMGSVWRKHFCLRPTIPSVGKGHKGIPKPDLPPAAFSSLASGQGKLTPAKVGNTGGAGCFCVRRFGSLFTEGIVSEKNVGCNGKVEKPEPILLIFSNVQMWLLQKNSFFSAF